jgi:hypothetical protein
LKTLTKYGVGLPRACLPISENSGVETPKHTVKAVLDGIKDLSLGGFLIKDHVELRFQVVSVVRYPQELRLVSVCECDNFLPYLIS